MVVIFTELMDEDTLVRRLVEACYMIASVLFIFSLSGLKKPESSRQGVFYGVCGMTLAIVSTFFLREFHSEYVRMFVATIPGAIIGITLAVIIDMLQVPQMVASLHSFVGLAATFVGFSNYFLHINSEPSVLRDIETFVGVYIGIITFAGSVIAAMKLAEIGGGDFGEFVFKMGPFRHVVNGTLFGLTLIAGIIFCIDDTWAMGLYINVVLGIILGCLMVFAVGGADMPVIISMLNSLSGWATVASGFLLNNNVLIVTGSVVGSSGAILSYIMCTSMNRSFLQVLLTRFTAVTLAVAPPTVATNEVNSQQVYEILKQAKDIIIVPGYGMAAGKGQKQVGQLAKLLRKQGKKVRFCLHPVAGRMPGHMNILLSEAKVPINMMFELSNINKDFENADVAFVVGCNDTVNPAAYEEGSAIFGMAVCDVWKAKHVFVMKRKRGGVGFAGIDNAMFDYENTGMYLGSLNQRLSELLALMESQYNPEEVKLAVDAPTEQVVTSTEAVISSEELKKFKSYKTIGVPKEIADDECRVALIPKTITKLRKLGFAVNVESGAGEKAGIIDNDFERAGAEIVDTKTAWSSEIVIKIREPLHDKANNKPEADYIEDSKVLVCGIDPAIHKTQMEELKLHDNLTVWSMRCVPRITRAQKLDTLSSMGKLDGYRAIIEAFKYYRGFAGPQFTAAGKIDPAKVFVIGCGVIGLASIGTAAGLGAKVQAFDARAKGRSDGESIGAEIVIDEDLKADEGAGVGGYAKEMGADYYDKQRAFFKRVLKDCDIVVSTARVPGKSELILINEETVRSMKRGSVIMDVSGMNCSLTKKGQVYVDKESQVTISGITSFVGEMPGQASELYSNNMFNLLEELCQIPKNKENTAANFTIDLKDEIADEAVVIQHNKIRWIPYSERVKQASQKPPEAKTEKRAPKPPQPKPEAGPLTQKLIDKEGDDAVEKVAKMDLVSSSLIVGSMIVLALSLAYATDIGFMMNFLIFTLALIIGYIVIWGVDPLLHASLMSETNAISGIIYIGAMLQLYGYNGSFQLPNVCGITALFFASINVFGGFVLTDRMLGMIS
eukprot:TRINITY_DN28_c0_g1_i6.p1 TRINITY_DN28_c0_g1~~TRINITY_DN28_c0_g1_i6.p1  ORF type:complete len:1064 (-),score=332.43 TRINITY_DN28_c0_g1_i6:152-3343(-)